MKLSKKSRYGIIALIDLSINSKNGHVKLSSIAERNDISLQYLAGLRRHGIIKSIKGAQGGYLLNQSAKDITVALIIEALDGTYKIEKEYEGQGNIAEQVIEESVIDKVNEKLDEVLLNISLEDLEKDYLQSNDFSQYMYYI